MVKICNYISCGVNKYVAIYYSGGGMVLPYYLVHLFCPSRVIIGKFQETFRRIPHKKGFFPLDFHWNALISGCNLISGVIKVGQSVENSPPKIHHVLPRVFSLAMRAARFFPSKKPDPFSASPEAAGEAAGPSWRRWPWPQKLLKRPWHPHLHLTQLGSGEVSCQVSW